MPSIYSRNYWRIGFQSRLYDLLTPEAYLESLRRVVACVSGGNGKIWLDAGCGTGALLPFLQDGLRAGDRYMGTDLLLPGLATAREKAETLQVADRVMLFQSDLTRPFPLPADFADVIVAHFSLYTMDSAEKRKQALQKIHGLLRPGGILVLVEPSSDYDARRILEESVSTLRAREGMFQAGLKKWLLYPLTYRFGLRFIERQLKKGLWVASSRENLWAEIQEAGFQVHHIEPVYAGSAHLVVAG